MALYKYNTSGVFSEIKEKPFKLERDIHVSATRATYEQLPFLLGITIQ